MQVFGIDISVWQKDMNLAQAKKEGVKFAVTRAMYGNAKDTAFENNYKKIVAQGLGVGAYQWGRAKNKAQAKEEAELLIEHCLKGKKFDYPIYYDVEDSIMIGLSKHELTDVIDTWCKTMESHGYFCGIYMSYSAMNSETEKAKLLAKYSAWIAYWTTTAKKPACQMWQFGGETNLVRTNKVAGVTCDQDYAYEDFPKIIKDRGLNNYPAPANASQGLRTVTSNKDLVVKFDDGAKLWRSWSNALKSYVKYTGVAGNSAGWWYLKDGVVDFTKNSVEHNDNGWWYIKEGKVDFNFTGWAGNSAGLWYCVKGKVDFDKTNAMMKSKMQEVLKNAKFSANQITQFLK